MRRQGGVGRIEAVFKKYNPLGFEYKLSTRIRPSKFNDESGVGNGLPSVRPWPSHQFRNGYLRLSAFIAEQGTKEIAGRKALGASVVSVWLHRVRLDLIRLC
jgi:hypothetical protein